MVLKISKWALATPSVVVIAMALGLLNKYGIEDIFTHVLHIAQFILIVFTLVVMNLNYNKLFKLYDKKQKDTTET